MHCVFIAAAGVAFGVFCPSLAAKIKKAFSKEATAAKTAATSAVSGAVSAEVKKL
jgi:hypothetical protein